MFVNVCELVYVCVTYVNGPSEPLDVAAGAVAPPVGWSFVVASVRFLVRDTGSVLLHPCVVWESPPPSMCAACTVVAV